MSVLSKAKAAELMQTDVLELAVDDSVEAAVSTFEEYHISGAPVVGTTGELLGFLSTHDIARSDHTRTGKGEKEGAGYEFSSEDDEFFSHEDYSPEVLGSELVKDWMNPEVISVPPEASLKKLCQVMVAESIHRVLVVEDKKLRGIVTTTDVVRFLAEKL